MNVCSFCGRPQNEVGHLVSADDRTFICPKCVEAAGQIIASKQSEDNGEEEEAPLLKPHEIKAWLDQYVIGQETAKVDVSIAVYNHYKRRKFNSIFDGVEIGKSNILLAGPSGTGKTEIARSIARLLKVPFYVADASRLTQDGYVGADADSLLQGLLSDAGGDIEKAQWGIVFLDEFDKMARKSGRGPTGYRDVSGEGIQQVLLRMIEGGVVNIAPQRENIPFDTSNVLFICAGAFAGIEEIVQARVNKGANKVGFGSRQTKIKLDDPEIYQYLEEEDFLDFGIIPELLGRIPVRTATNKLSESDMVRILTEPKNALVKQYKALFAMDGVKLVFDEAFLKAIGKQASERATGARSLRSLLEKALHQYSYEVPKDDTITEIHLTEMSAVGAPAKVVRGKREPVDPNQIALDNKALRVV